MDLALPVLTMPADFFISHASEDKDAIARPLALALRARGWSVWFDEFELTVGDSLRRKIDRGLADARYGIVILSPAFFAKEWPQRELDALTAREVSVAPTKVILPVWHAVDHDYVAQYSPLLAARLATSSARGIDAIADDLERAVKSPSAAPRSFFAEGALLLHDGEYWLLAGGARFRLPSEGIRDWLYRDLMPQSIERDRLEQIPQIPRDGALLRDENGPIYVIYGGARFHIPDPRTLARLYDAARVQHLWPDALQDLSTTPRDGTLLREELDDHVYRIQRSQRILVDMDTTTRAGVVWRGALSRFRLVDPD